jgi:type I restriction enzyme R subunit
MLNKKTLLDLVRHFVVFEQSKKEDPQNRCDQHPVKKIAAYHQYYAVKPCVRRPNEGAPTNLLPAMA